MVPTVEIQTPNLSRAVNRTVKGPFLVNLVRRWWTEVYTEAHLGGVVCDVGGWNVRWDFGVPGLLVCFGFEEGMGRLKGKES